MQTENICIFVTLILRNTKRYARLANGNVRNFYDVQESITVRAVIAWTVYHVCISGSISQPPLEDAVYQYHASFISLHLGTVWR